MSKFQIPKDEKTGYLITRIGLGILLGLFILLGLIVKPEGAGSTLHQAYLWDAFHPFSVGDFFGTVFILCGFLWISGWWQNFVFLSSMRGIQPILLGLAALGVVLIFAS